MLHVGVVGVLRWRSASSACSSSRGAPTRARSSDRGRHLRRARSRATWWESFAGRVRKRPSRPSTAGPGCASTSTIASELLDKGLAETLAYDAPVDAVVALDPKANDFSRSPRCRSAFVHSKKRDARLRRWGRSPSCDLANTR